MKLFKKLSIFSCFILLFTACKKQLPPTSAYYYKDYWITYSQATDSYSAGASFTGMGADYSARLPKYQSIRFNGRLQDNELSDFEVFYYLWQGKGKPNANFKFTSGRGISNIDSGHGVTIH